MNARSTPGVARRPARRLRDAALAALFATALAACQTVEGLTGGGEPSAPPAPGWHVVERIGDVRFATPDATDGAVAMPGRAVPSGSRVTTGRGGRLIVARPGAQIAAGTGARFGLPGSSPDGTVTQAAGRVRYRIAGGPLVVETPSLRVEAPDGVFVVSVEGQTSEVDVETGRVRVAARDGTRAADLGAHQTALLRADDVLRVRQGEGDAFEPAPTAPLSDPATAVASPAAPAPPAAEASPPALAEASEAPVRAVDSEAATAAADARPPVALADAPGATARPAVAIEGEATSEVARAGGETAAEPARPPVPNDAGVVVPAAFGRAGATAVSRPEIGVEAGSGARPAAAPDAASAERRAPGTSRSGADPTTETAVRPAPPPDPFDRLTGGLLQSLPAVPVGAEPAS